MVDHERVERYLGVLDRASKRLDEISSQGQKSFEANEDTQLLTERLLQVAIQACIDIGAHVIAESGFESPDDYGSVFDILAQNDVIERDLAEQLIKATGTRNVLVHAYLDIDLALIWVATEQRDSLVDFAQAIDKYLG